MGLSSSVLQAFAAALRRCLAPFSLVFAWDGAAEPMIADVAVTRACCGGRRARSPESLPPSPVAPALARFFLVQLHWSRSLRSPRSPCCAAERSALCLRPHPTTRSRLWAAAAVLLDLGPSIVAFYELTSQPALKLLLEGLLAGAAVLGAPELGRLGPAPRLALLGLIAAAAAILLPPRGLDAPHETAAIAEAAAAIRATGPTTDPDRLRPRPRRQPLSSATDSRAADRLLPLGTYVDRLFWAGAPRLAEALAAHLARAVIVAVADPARRAKIERPTIAASPRMRSPVSTTRSRHAAQGAADFYDVYEHAGSFEAPSAPDRPDEAPTTKRCQSPAKRAGDCEAGARRMTRASRRGPLSCRPFRFFGSPRAARDDGKRVVTPCADALPRCVGKIMRTIRPRG